MKYYIGDIVYPKEFELYYSRDYKPAQKIYGVVVDVNVDDDDDRTYAVKWCDSETREEIDLDFGVKYAWFDSNEFVSQQEYLEELKRQCEVAIEYGD